MVAAHLHHGFPPNWPPRALHRSAKTSCVAVLSHDGASDLFHGLVKQAELARKQWAELSAYYPDDRAKCRRLVLRLESEGFVKGGARQVPVDQLLLHAMTVAIDDED